MFINLTIEFAGVNCDIRIDGEQKIGDSVKVLQERGLLPVGYDPSYFRSHVRQKLVSAYRTFSEEGIYDGDILTVL